MRDRLPDRPEPSYGSTEVTHAPPRAIAATATVVLGVSGVAALAALAMSLPHLWDSLSALQIFVFFVLPAAWCVASIVALRTTKETRIGFALLQLSLACALLVGEVGATLWLRARHSATMQPSMRDEVLRYRAAGVDAFPRIAGNQIVDFSPQFRHNGAVLRPVTPAPAHATILFCSEDRPMLTYQSDRYGFDNPDSAWSASQADLAIVGDSYTVGMCVPSDSAIPGRLRRHGFVLNLGMSGAGPLQELAAIREYAGPLNPRQVVWIFYEGNDFWDLRREAERAWLTAYLDGNTTQSLRYHHETLDTHYRVWIDSLLESAFSQPLTSRTAHSLSVRSVASLTALRALMPIDVQRPGRASDIGLLPAIFERADADVRSWGGTLLVVYMPAYRRYRSVLGDPFPDRRAVLDTLRGLGIQTLDLHETFAATGNPRTLWVTPRSHLTAEGYALAAEAIAGALGLGVVSLR